jgi:hypothetical protein
MMIDVFVVLVPLAVLPIVLLFGFVGCSVPDFWIGSIALQWGAGFNGDIKSLEVTFQYLPNNGESSSSYIVSATLTDMELTSFFGGQSIDKTGVLHLSSVPNGTLTCNCVITQTVTAQTTAVNDSQPMEPNTWTPAFILSRNGTGFETTNFLLTIAPEPN